MASDAPTLLEELRRRKVVRVGIAYGMASWALLQVVDVVAPILEVSDATVQVLFWLLVAGFPVAVFLAWAFELTPEGIRSTERARREYGEAQHEEALQKRRNRLAYLSGIIGPAMLIGGGLGAAAVWTFVRPPAEQEAADVSAETLPTIAVLPFRNMSPDPDNAFFAEGVHEEILTRLSRLSAVRVISRTSVMQFTDELPTIPEIAEMLNATHIVEGSVRRAGNSVRITAQLIDAGTDQHLWAENYDRRLEDVFAIQTAVAASIADAMSVRFEMPANTAHAADRPLDLRAYDLYVKARSRAWSIGQDFDEVLAFLEEAVALDRDYVEAWQLLAKVRSWPSFIGTDHAGTYLAAARDALAQAKQLAPETTDTLIAEAWVRYWGERDFEGAANLVSRARKREPTRAELIDLQALTARRLGRWDDFFLLREQGLELDPLNYGGRQDLAFNLRRFGRYQDSYRQYVELLNNTPTPDPWLELEVEIARVLTAPDSGQWQNLMDQFLADGFPAESPRGQSWADTRVLEYLLLKDQRNAYWQERPVQGPDLTSDIYAMGRKYFEVEMLFFLGQSEEGMQEARAAYEAALEIERRIRDDGSWSPQGIELLALYKARLGSRLGESDQVAESLAHLETGLDDPDHALRRATLYRYIEALATADTREAQRVYLAADPEVVMPHDFALRPHLFHSLLDEPRVRARFDDKPEWVQFMRDSWPESRPFPFDQDET